jgi:hypothetical protein
MVKWGRIEIDSVGVPLTSIRSESNMMRFVARCAVAVMAVCLSVTALPGKDLVLCIRTNGYIAFESAQNGVCIEGHRMPDRNAVAPPGENCNNRVNGDCIACVDIPLSQGPVVGPSSAPNGMKKKPASLSNFAVSAVLPARLAQNLSGTAPCTSLSPSDNGDPSCDPSRILRI